MKTTFANQYPSLLLINNHHIKFFLKHFLDTLYMGDSIQPPFFKQQLFAWQIMNLCLQQVKSAHFLQRIHKQSMLIE